MFCLNQTLMLISVNNTLINSYKDMTHLSVPKLVMKHSLVKKTCDTRVRFFFLFIARQNALWEQTEAKL